VVDAFCDLLCCDHIRSKTPICKFFKILARNEIHRETAKKAFPGEFGAITAPKITALGLLKTIDLEGYRWANLQAAQADAIRAIHAIVKEEPNDWIRLSCLRNRVN